MNENTLTIRIAETEEKLANSFNPEEQAMLSAELKNYKQQLSNLKNFSGKKKEPVLKTNIDAPIIGDRPKSNYNGRQSIVPSSNDTFVVGI